MDAALLAEACATWESPGPAGIAVVSACAARDDDDWKLLCAVARINHAAYARRHQYGLLIATWPADAFLNHADRRVTMDAKCHAAAALAVMQVFGGGAPHGAKTSPRQRRMRVRGQSTGLKGERVMTTELVSWIG